MIEFNAVSKIYAGNDRASVDSISFSIAKGETLVLMGSSGSGKTTLLKMVNLLQKPSAGFVAINGRDVRDYNIQELRRSIGYIFQGVGLFRHMTVAENLDLPLKLAHVPKEECIKRVNELLSFMSLPPAIFRDRFPSELSGGEQQRVGVARALVLNPDILLMDEPFGALDLITRAELQEEIVQLKKEFNKTIILVTHDMLEAFKLGDKVAIMHRGRLEQIGSQEELIKNPQTPFVKQFMHAGLRGVKN